MLIDLICVVVLIHFHIVGKLVFKTFFEMHKWQTRLVAGLVVLLCAMVFVEFFVFCGWPEDCWQLVSFRCREPGSVLIEYSVVFLLAASDYLHDSNFFVGEKPEDKQKTQARRKRGFKKSFVTLVTFSWLLYLTETGSDLLNVAKIYESVPKPWEKRPSPHPGQKRVKEKRKRAADKRK